MIAATHKTRGVWGEPQSFVYGELYFYRTAVCITCSVCAATCMTDTLPSERACRAACSCTRDLVRFQVLRGLPGA